MRLRVARKVYDALSCQKGCGHRWGTVERAAALWEQRQRRRRFSYSVTCQRVTPAGHYEDGEVIEVTIPRGDVFLGGTYQIYRSTRLDAGWIASEGAGGNQPPDTNKEEKEHDKNKRERGPDR